MWTILDRLKEPSSYAGLSVLALLFVTEEEWQIISTALASLFALAAMFLKEKK